jgi:small subunit ribosomal protein S6e
MSLKIVMGTKSGKTFQRVLTGEEAEALFGRVLGEEVNGELFGYSGVKFQITGGSDSSGFPMRKDLPGQVRKKILVGKSIGFKGKNSKGNKFNGLRVKKTVSGNTIYEKTNQLNLKVVSGEDKLAKAFAPEPEEAPAEESAEAKKE